MTKKTRINAGGFTIVELLIVIVVIAILAAVSVVAYTNIQNRTYDSVVQNDLTNLAKQIQLAAAETGELPIGGRLTPTSGGTQTGTVIGAPQPSIDVRIARSSYDEPTASGSVNLTYCAGPGDDSGRPEYIITAKSRSGNRFQYSSMRGLEARGTGSVAYPATICAGIGYPHSYSYGYSYNQSGWQSWVR